MKVVDGIEIGIECDTTALDEALDKTAELGELTQDLAPQVSIRNCRNCTFNIYPSRTAINEYWPTREVER